MDDKQMEAKQKSDKYEHLYLFEMNDKQKESKQMFDKCKYAYFLEKYHWVSNYEWVRFKQNQQSESDSRYFHSLSAIKEDTYVTTCGLSFPRESTPVNRVTNMGNPYNEETEYFVEGAPEHLEVKCYNCLEKQWKDLESYYKTVDPEFFDGEYGISILPLPINLINRKYITKMVENKGIKEVRRLINDLIERHSIEEEMKEKRTPLK